MYSGILFRLSKDENLTHATALINLENILLSEINQAQNDQNCLILSIQNTQNKKIHRESRINVLRSCGHGRIGSYCLMSTELILWWWKVKKVDICDGCSTLFTENHWIVWLDMVKMLNLMLYIFNHSEKKKQSEQHQKIDYIKWCGGLWDKNKRSIICITGIPYEDKYMSEKYLKKWNLKFSQIWQKSEVNRKKINHKRISE